MIWYNNQIKVGDKCVYYKYWLSAEVYFIGDHLDDNGCFLSLNDFRFKVRTNFIEYGAILRAIKVAFKNNNNIPDPMLALLQATFKTPLTFYVDYKPSIISTITPF